MGSVTAVVKILGVATDSMLYGRILSPEYVRLFIDNLTNDIVRMLNAIMSSCGTID